MSTVTPLFGQNKNNNSGYSKMQSGDHSPDHDADTVLEKNYTPDQQLYYSTFNKTFAMYAGLSADIKSRCDLTMDLLNTMAASLQVQIDSTPRTSENFSRILEWNSQLQDINTKKIATLKTFNDDIEEMEQTKIKTEKLNSDRIARARAKKNKGFNFSNNRRENSSSIGDSKARRSLIGNFGHPEVRNNYTGNQMKRQRIEEEEYDEEE